MVPPAQPRIGSPHLRELREGTASQNEHRKSDRVTDETEACHFELESLLRGIEGSNVARAARAERSTRWPPRTPDTLVERQLEVTPVALVERRPQWQ